CIGISVAATALDARVVLVDNSLAALRIARHNCLRNSVTRNTAVIEADAMHEPPMLLGRFDIIVSNPPYVPTAELPTLESSVRDFEPPEALDGGADGLDFYRFIIPHWTGILRENGCLLFECGEGQADAIEKLMRENGFVEVFRYKDGGGTERVVAGRL
ncbi:MAG: N5-glutamine methyltransferase family protein, partial [bacterium]